MDFNSADSIYAAGFRGFSTVRELQGGRCLMVPEEPGIYLILRGALHSHTLTETNCGGRFKGKDPTVPLSRLQKHWVDGSPVIYIGKAGGGQSKATLRGRLWAYVRFGAGEPVAHWGGRFIWQLQNSPELVVCWRQSAEQDAAVLESSMIKDFTAVYGRRPFANLRN
jgi:hypothetical protein